jgi:hypothetical protein
MIGTTLRGYGEDVADMSHLDATGAVVTGRRLFNVVDRPHG